MNGVMDEIMIDQLADAFLGTAQSTFSCMIHARALLIPHYVGHVLEFSMVAHVLKPDRPA